MSVMFLSVASLWAYSSETPSSIKRFFVALFTTIFAPRSALHIGPVAHSGGPDGVRTRDHRIKSPTLYLTELQAQCSNLGLLSDLHALLIHFGMVVTVSATEVCRWPNQTTFINVP